MNPSSVYWASWLNDELFYLSMITNVNQADNQEYVRRNHQ